jgi:hypothetical protein
MECVECGATFTSKRYDQRFCNIQHKNSYHQRLFSQRHASKYDAALQASSETDDLKREHERLKEQNESLKDSIRKYDKHISDKDKETDHWRDLLRIRDEEIERLKLERRVYQQEKTKKAHNLTRDHLERVLTSEIRRQFPNDTIIQEHIGAIRAFNASYINALVTSA